MKEIAIKALIAIVDHYHDYYKQPDKFQPYLIAKEAINDLSKVDRNEWDLDRQIWNEVDRQIKIISPVS